MNNYRIVHGETRELPDIANFLERLNGRGDEIFDPQQFFDSANDLFVTRAPGRLDVMGGIADYSGSLVLELPIREATFVALQKDEERTLRILSLSEDGQSNLNFTMPLDDFKNSAGPIDYETARARFRSEPGADWAAYIAGVFLVLQKEYGVHFEAGARILISSNIPRGKGVSSSAALEVAVMQAVVAAFAVKVEPLQLALFCQAVENLVVGAPCGVMDQTTSNCGDADQLLAILCQPAELLGMVAIPSDVEFWGIDSGIRHSVSGSDYGSVRAGAFMGYRIIAELAQLGVTKSGEEQVVQIEDGRWGGYLANVTPSEFEQFFAPQLPEKISGAEFLQSYQGIIDPLSRVDPDRDYAVRVPTAHAIYEHHRVRIFSELLSLNTSEQRLKLLGELMYQSHASYSACGLGSTGTDHLVKLVREAGTQSGLYGAKITGGGSGGTVAILARRNSDRVIRELAYRYAKETGNEPYVFQGSSPGSAAFGHLRLSRN